MVMTNYFVYKKCPVRGGKYGITIDEYLALLRMRELRADQFADELEYRRAVESYFYGHVTASC